MRINKNRTSKISILTLMAICLSVFSVASVHAASGDACANSNICAAPPAGFRLMTSFIKEMVTAIKTVGTRAPYVGQYVSPSRFDAGQFNPPKEGLVSKFMQNIRQKLDSLLAITAVFTDPQNLGGVKDFAGGLVILVKKKLFLRDYKTLMDIDSMISDKEYELGLGGGWTDKLNPANRNMFQKIFAKYVDEGLFANGARINQSATYRQIIMLMARIDSSLKTFIASPGLSITQFASEFTKTKLFAESSDIQITFNPQMIAAMKADYQCAGTVKCNTAMSGFIANITKISTTFGSGVVNVGKTFANASKRLAIALWGGGTGATQADKDAVKKRQQELLRTQFGLKTAQINSGGLLGLKNYRQMILDAAAAFTGGWQTLTKDLRDNNQRAALFSGANKTIIPNVVISSKNNTMVDISDTTDIRISMNQLLSDASSLQASAIIADNVDVTYPFAQVFKTMRTTIDQVIGNRNTDDSLIKNLGEACKAQCANAGGDCFN